MKSLEARFSTVFEKNPYWSSFICFSEAIKKQKFTKPIINRWFRKLVDKDDYQRSDKNKILQQLYDYSNVSEER